jgi:hypothetical protein
VNTTETQIYNIRKETGPFLHVARKNKENNESSKRNTNKSKHFEQGTQYITVNAHLQIGKKKWHVQKEMYRLSTKIQQEDGSNIFY